jgi:hypothetical protein
MQACQTPPPHPEQRPPVVQPALSAQQSQQRVRVGVYSQQLSTPALPQQRYAA